MKLYLVQHGEALPEEVDKYRSLSPKGRDKVTKLTIFLKRVNLNLSEIWHSEKTRARQTAEILSKELIPAKELKQKKGLLPNDPPERMLEEVNVREDDLMIVGHLPFLQKLTSLLLLESSEKNLVGFEKGSLLCLERKDDTWQIYLFLTPDLLGDNRE